MKIQLDIPKTLNKKLRIYCAEKELKDKRIAILEILFKYFKEKRK